MPLQRFAGGRFYKPDWAALTALAEELRWPRIANRLDYHRIWWYKSFVVRALFLLPIRDNDGRSLAAEISAVEDRCFVEFGAWTAGGYFKGAWRMETGERVLDTTAVYILYLERGLLADLREILREFKSKTAQEAILLEVTESVDVELI